MDTDDTTILLTVAMAVQDEPLTAEMFRKILEVHGRLDLLTLVESTAEVDAVTEDTFAGYAGPNESEVSNGHT